MLHVHTHGSTPGKHCEDHMITWRILQTDSHPFFSKLAKTMTKVGEKKSYCKGSMLQSQKLMQNHHPPSYVSCEDAYVRIPTFMVFPIEKLFINECYDGQTYRFWLDSRLRQSEGFLSTHTKPFHSSCQ